MSKKDDRIAELEQLVHSLEGQVAYLARRCLEAEGNAGDVRAMEELLGDAEDFSSL